MTGPEAAWAAYRREVFGEPYMVWHDGADFTEIARRYAADRTFVLAMIAEGIAENDDVAAEAARYLEPNAETPDIAARSDIVVMLEAALPAASGSTRVEVATSLHTLGGSPDLARHLVDVLQSPTHWGVRIDAARQLAVFPPTRELVAAVGKAVQDPDYLVRYHSANTLLVWAHRTGGVTANKRVFGLLTTNATPEDWAVAAAELAAAVQI